MMNKIDMDFKNSLCAYKQIQEKHLDLFRSGSFPEVTEMSQERKMAFRALKKNFSIFKAVKDQSGQDFLGGIAELLRAVKALDEAIGIEINRHKGRIQKSLSEMKKGKKAIRSYMTAGTNHDFHRVVSINR